MRIVTKTTRRLIALTAAYAIALQAALAGVVLLAASAHATPQICAAVGHDPQSGSLPMGSDCAACPALCGGAGPDADLGHQPVAADQPARAADADHVVGAGRADRSGT